MFIFQKIIHHLRQYEFIKIVIQVYNHLSTIDKPILKWRFYPKIFCIIQDLNIPLHEHVHLNCQRLLARGMYIGDFYLAQSLLLQNKLDEAEKHINSFINQYPNHSDGLYLLAEIKRRNKEKQAAFVVLQNILQHNRRGKTWQHLSNLVDNTADFEQFHDLFVQTHPNYAKKVLPYDLACHLSNAAIRAQKTEFVLDFWRNQYRLLQQKKPTIQTAKTPISRQYNDKKAEKALHDLKVFLDQKQITFFLISGTLLGCIREDKLLEHDKDIDIGVWENHTVHELANIIYDSTYFHVLPIYSPDILVIRHVNGVTIDIFIHYREIGDYWHAGGKSKWHNSPFELTNYPFLNDYYLIPSNYDLYLTENYGDWRTPKVKFDSVLDTPNMEIASQSEFVIYLYKKVIFALHTGQKPSERYLSILREHGEHWN